VIGGHSRLPPRVGDKEGGTEGEEEDAGTITHYQKRIFGPLLDRIDVHLEVPRIDCEQLADRRAGEPSASVRGQVEKARAVQAKRFAGTRPWELQEHVALDGTGEGLMRSAIKQMHFSARAYHRILKLAQTIAVLAGAERVAASHVAQVLQYRPR